MRYIARVLRGGMDCKVRRDGDDFDMNAGAHRTTVGFDAEDWGFDEKFWNYTFEVGTEEQDGDRMFSRSGTMWWTSDMPGTVYSDGKTKAPICDEYLRKLFKTIPDVLFIKLLHGDYYMGSN